MAAITLQYDNAREVQQLFDNDPSNLRLVQDLIGVTITARDGWIKLEGNEAMLEQAKEVFNSLQSLLTSGQTPHQQDIIKAIETVRDSGSDTLKSISSVRIATSPRKPQITPKTLGQKEYVQSIEGHDVTFGIGPAGTGKTYLAMALAVSALYRGDVSRIVLTRPAVEAGEALGFLPGDADEKLHYYNLPFMDKLDELLNETTVKKLQKKENSLFLLSANSDYPSIQVKEEMECFIWGVVTYVIHAL